jgi:hypothetical protein
VKNRFQHLPFKCNLQRYTTVSAKDEVDASVRLAGGLAVEKSVAIQGGLKVLDFADGKESGAVGGCTS